ncbi:MAG: prolipoprotein diacylglyceryl transferase [Clostridia bacterium]
MLNFLLINPVAFEIGKISVKWYGIILTSAMVLGLFILMKMCKKKGISSDDSLELFLWLIPTAVIFARLVYVVANNSTYDFFPIKSWDDFINVIAIWDGGVTIYGGILGGIIGGLVWCKRKKVSVGLIFDICVPILLLCQSIGRWGNFCNQEAYGQLVTNPKLFTLPFAVFIEAEGAWFQATFLYESIINFCGSMMFFFFWKKIKVEGIFAPLYLSWYCSVRLIMDFMRVDGLLVTKITCCIVIPLGIIICILHYIKGLKKIEHERVRLEVQAMLDNNN